MKAKRNGPHLQNIGLKNKQRTFIAKGFMPMRNAQAMALQITTV